MTQPQKILQVAQEKAQKEKLPYAGALSPKDAYAVLTQMPAFKLVDVRSKAELDFVGRIPGVIEVELKTYPGMQPNPAFLEQLTQHANKDTPLFFLCRSGARSNEAATLAANAGYTAYNVLEGFEGDKDAHGHRNTVGGWRARGLPWSQS